MKNRHPLLFPALALACSLILCEGLARRLLPEMQNSVEFYRNAYRYRGWPEYMGTPDRVDASTVALLTNCQGYGGEYSGVRGYPLLLEGELRRRAAGGSSDWEVLNWSLDGASSIEYMIEAAYLGRHPPDAVLAVTGYGDYRNEHYHEGLSYCRSDIPRLISRPWLVRALPGSFRRRHFRFEDVLTFVASDMFALLRFREFMWSWLDRRFPGVHNVFYAPEFRHLPWSLPKHPLIDPIELPRAKESALQVTYGAGSRQMLREYMRQLSLIPAKVVVVAEPAAYPPDEPNERRFLEDLKLFSREYGLTFWDLHDALPTEYFLTTAHLHRRNHVRMAEILAERLDNLLADPKSERHRSNFIPRLSSDLGAAQKRWRFLDFARNDTAHTVMSDIRDKPALE